MRVGRLSGLLGVAVIVSAAFGVADRIVQGHSADGWYLANVAGVWLAVAFVFGAAAVRGRDAAVLGLLAEISALVGYYGFKHFVQHEHEPTSHLVVWFTCALVAAPLFGLLGYRWRRRRSQLAGLVLGAVFVAEALLLGLTNRRPARIAVAELLGGILLAVALLALARWRNRHGAPRRTPARMRH